MYSRLTTALHVRIAAVLQHSFPWAQFVQAISPPFGSQHVRLCTTQTMSKRDATSTPRDGPVMHLSFKAWQYRVCETSPRPRQPVSSISLGLETPNCKGRLRADSKSARLLFRRNGLYKSEARLNPEEQGRRPNASNTR